MSKNNNSNLHAAKTAKNDEFYTQLSDIENELRHYKHHFAGKTVLCNCDDPYESNFFKYFALNFRSLGLKKLIATCYNSSPFAGEQLSLFDIPYLNTEYKKKAYKAIITEIPDSNNDGAIDIFDIQDLLKYGDNVITFLHGDGDFRSDECVELLDEADIVCTNCPFSLFREFINTLVEHNKKFLVIGTQNAITYKEIFPLIKENKLWLGFHSGDMAFKVPRYYEKKDTRYWEDESGQKWRSLGNVCWFTNLDISKRHEDLIFVEKYSPEKYPKYDNYDAINVDKVADIPEDYIPCWFHCPLAADCKYAQQKGMNAAAEGCCEKCNGQMGVPITFMDKHNSEQFEIVDADFNLAKPMSEVDPEGIYEKGGPAFYLRDNSNNNSSLSLSLSLGGNTSDCTRELLFEGRKCNGIMGAPITFLDKYNPEQFELIGIDRYIENNPKPGHRFTISGKETYARILLRKMQRNNGCSDNVPG